MSVSIEISLAPPLDCEQRIRAYVGNAVPVLSARLFRQFSAPWPVILPSSTISRNISLPGLYVNPLLLFLLLLGSITRKCTFSRR
jgi:hypothetical protein